MVDTGASLTDIMTNRINVKDITDPQNPVDSSSGNSWGKKTNFYETKLTAPCYLRHTELKGMKVSWSDNERLEKFNDNAGIYGLTGNAPFFYKVLVLDFKHQQVGIVR